MANNSAFYPYFSKKNNLNIPDHINEKKWGELMNQNIYKKSWNPNII